MSVLIVLVVSTIVTRAAPAPDQAPTATVEASIPFPTFDPDVLLEWAPAIFPSRYTMIYLHTICTDTEDACSAIGRYKGETDVFPKLTVFDVSAT